MNNDYPSIREQTCKRLADLGIMPLPVLLRYDEPQRFYHTWEHIEDLLKQAIDTYGVKQLDRVPEDIFLAIVFHDIIYNPKANDNEEKSAELFYSYIKDDEVYNAILETKTHKATSVLSKLLCKLDLAILGSSYTKFIDFEHKIFKEYQFHDYKLYQKGRVEILKGLGVKKEYIDYVANRKPSIAVYAGSFNPFHKGHLNILQKAEQIFDKVIIARGLNPGKKNELWSLPEAIQFRQIENYEGLLTDFINPHNLGYDVTLVRGIRNSEDLAYEQKQYRYLQDLKPDVKLVNIFCDKEFEHISSGAIRVLDKFGKGKQYLV